MGLRADPATIGGLSSELKSSSSERRRVQAPDVNMGPSIPAVLATVAELARAESGLTETMTTTAEDLDANKTTYGTTEASNEDLFRPIDRVIKAAEGNQAP